MRDDVRDALRALRADWRFTLTAAGLLAVTLGAITAIFAIVQAIVLHPFPFHDQDRLAVVWQRDLRRALPVIEVAYGEAVDWRARSRSFERIAVVGSVNWSLELIGKGETQSLSMAAVSAPFFDVVGTTPVLGRGFSPADEQGSLPRVAVISHGLWVRRYGRDPTIIGRAVAARLQANGPTVPIEVIGVAPEVFDYPRGTQIWVPAAPLIRMFGVAAGGEPEQTLAVLRVFFAIARLKQSATMAGAETDLSRVIRTTDTKSGPEPPLSAVVTPIAAHLLGPARPVLWTLFGGALLMLLIVCANVAGLQVSRATGLQRTQAVRAALGASNGRLVRQTFVESSLVTALALFGAVLVAGLVARSLVLLAPQGVPRIETVALLDSRVLAFGIAVTFIAIVLSGLWPALVAARLDVVRALAHSGSLAADPRGRRVQRGVVLAQVAISVTLIGGAALFARTVRALDQTALGFDPANLLALTVSPSVSDLIRWRGFYEALESHAAAVPDVTAVGSIYLRPLSGPIGLESQPIFPGQVPDDAKTWGLNPLLNLETVTPGYFRAMGIRMVRGRAFTTNDRASTPGVVIVGESTARRLWPGRDPLGQRMHNDWYRTETGRRGEWQIVIGVAQDVRYRGLTDVRLDLYMPAAQSDQRVQFLMVRARRNPAEVTTAIRRRARALDSAANVSEATLMSKVVANESAPWRFMVQVFVAFAALAAAAAAIGLGAVIALAVATRRRELAIRAALGADRARLRSAVLREGLWLIAGGTALGLIFAVALGRAVAALLVGIEPHDAIALGAATILVSATGLVACWWPARRAGDANPMEILRGD